MAPDLLIVSPGFCSNKEQSRDWLALPPVFFPVLQADGDIEQQAAEADQDNHAEDVPGPGPDDESARYLWGPAEKDIVGIEEHVHQAYCKKQWQAQQ